jgi:hypothetical protein
MSLSFSSEWLSLREPADHAARNRDVLAEVAAAFYGRDTLAIADLACGTGSNLRALAPALSVSRQQWTLIDHDPALLAAAREELSAWADSSDHSEDCLVLTKGASAIEVRFREASLVNGLECVRGLPLDLVTAAALFDLTSSAWMSDLVNTLAERRLPLYAALNYNGQEEWRPADDAWPKIHAAFLAHQCRDKGFDSAAGSQAWRVLTELLVRNGYATVIHGPSAWMLGRDERELLVRLAEGIAAAAAEQEHELEGEASRWVSSVRRAVASREAAAVIGHADIWSGLR